MEVLRDTRARLMAKGFTQTYGIDYQETFTPVAKIKSIRVLMSLVVIPIGLYTNWMLKMPYLTES